MLVRVCTCIFICAYLDRVDELLHLWQQLACHLVVRDRALASLTLFVCRHHGRQPLLIDVERPPCMHACTHVRTYVRTRTYMRMHVCMCVCVCVYGVVPGRHRAAGHRGRPRTHMHAYISTNIHRIRHTYVHIRPTIRSAALKVRTYVRHTYVRHTYVCMYVCMYGSGRPSGARPSK